MKRTLEQPDTTVASREPINYDTEAAAAYQALEAARKPNPGKPATTPVVRGTATVTEERQAKQLKREDSTVVRPVLPARLTRVPSNLVAQERALPKMARVTLRPSLELTDAGTIERVVISPGHRTPSPFGSRMGDHTVAWQAVVDAVRASLYGLTLQQAVDALAAAHTDVSDWMTEADSAGKERLALLSDAVRRAERLEDSAYWVRTHLDTARTAIVRIASALTPEIRAQELRKAVGGIELAVAYHLTYVNYLPYSTVPVYSSGGSKGSGEGTYRRLVLNVEAPGSDIDKEADVDDFIDDEAPAEESDVEPEEGTAPGPDEASEDEPEDPAPAPVVVQDPALRLRTALWKLFSFEAAFRATRTGMALQPNSADTVTNQHDQLKALVADMVKQIDYRAAPKQPSSVDRAFVTDPTKTLERQQREAQTLRTGFKDSGPDFDHLYRLAGVVADVAETLKSTLIKPALAKGTATALRNKLGTLRPLAMESAETVSEAARAALPNGATVLAYLLHDHQLTMVTAYPRAVRDSGFLAPRSPASTTTAIDGGTPRPGPCAAALEQLTAELAARADTTMPYTAKRLKELLVAVESVYRGLTQITVPGTGAGNDWARHRAPEALVVTYTPSLTDPVLTVNGRAPAPRGVAGMGSHTTAWVVEVAATDTLAAVGTDVLANFRASVTADLRSGVMRLDCLLPLDQLRGGQLRLLFNTATKVLEATQVNKAAALYLRFRNLLPYATVDAGDRGGHGEDLTQSSIVCFDTGSLRQAAELHANTLSVEADRAEVAKGLDTLSRSLVSRPDAGWGTHDVICDAVVACSRRLNAQSRALMTGPPTNVVPTILGTRWAEHERTYRAAATSRMAAQAKARKTV